MAGEVIVRPWHRRKDRRAIERWPATAILPGWGLLPGSTSDRRQGWAIDLSGGLLVGRITLRDIQPPWYARLGIYLHPDYYGQGIGQAALRAFLPIAPVHTIWLDVAAHNARAIRCYEKVGFVVQAINGASIEMCIMTPLGQQDMREILYASSRPILDDLVSSPVHG